MVFNDIYNVDFLKISWSFHDGHPTWNTYFGGLFKDISRIIFFGESVKNNEREFFNDTLERSLNVMFQRHFEGSTKDTISIP